jgi:acetyl esterase/lipase
MSSCIPDPIKESSMNKTLLFPAVTLASLLSVTCATAGPAGETNATSAGDQAWPEIHPSITNLAYAEKSPAEKLDLYLPAAGNAPAPLVIWIHGGAFMVGDKHSMPRRNFGPPPKPTGLFGPFQVQVPNAAVLVSRGYAVVSLNYRLSKSFLEGALPGVQDGKAAVRFLRANAGKYNLDPNRFAVWGNSAGGYMAAIIGVTGDQPTIFDGSHPWRHQHFQRGPGMHRLVRRRGPASCKVANKHLPAFREGAARLLDCQRRRWPSFPRARRSGFRTL